MKCLHPKVSGLRLVYLRPNTVLLHVSPFILTLLASAATPPAAPTFNKDILPILQTRCQPCHRPGEVAPMALVTYDQVRPWGKAMVDSVKAGKMPPWFSDKCCGQFSTEHTLKPEEIAAIEAWVAGGSQEGKKKDAPRPVQWTNEWRIDGPSLVISIPRPFEIPANSKIESQYVILPIDLAEDKWASSVEIHPGDRSVVDSAVLYVRTKNSTWLRNLPRLTMSPGEPAPLNDPSTEILTVYTPGSAASIWPDSMGKRLAAGSDLVLKLHYTSKKAPATDRTSVGINFLKERPTYRVLTLAMPSTSASASGVMPRDVLLLGMFPEMSARGREFEYSIVPPDGKAETLLVVKPYDHSWPQSYPLKTPRRLAKGTRILCAAHFDGTAVDSMIGFFDVAVEANTERVVFSSSAP